jgi:lambda family phage minor tail protein L
MTVKMNAVFSNALQSLYAGEVITLIEIDGTKFGANVYRMHNENIRYTPEELMAAQQTGVLAPKNITFRGNEYGARPFGIGGIEMNSDGTAAKPTLTISNLDGQAAAMIRVYNGMMQAKVTMWITTADMMQPDGTVADGDFRKFVYYIERPDYADKNFVRFTLTSPYDMDGVMVPPRLTQSVCFWAQRGWYRSGKGCGYNGNRYFDKDNNPVSDPSQDVCAGTGRACELRFGSGNELDFGGCVVASLLRKNQ